MSGGQLVLVDCKLRGGAFSGERVFRLSMSRDLGDYIGISPVDRCMGVDQRPLDPGQPAGGGEIDGLIKAYLIRNGGDEAVVGLPDGEAIVIPAGQVRYRQASDRGSRYVSVGS